MNHGPQNYAPPSLHNRGCQFPPQTPASPFLAPIPPDSRDLWETPNVRLDVESTKTNYQFQSQKLAQSQKLHLSSFFSFLLTIVFLDSAKADWVCVEANSIRP